MTDLIYKEECYTLVGLCMEVHKILGKGFSVAIYKDALENELKDAGIQYKREKEYEVSYKDRILKHKYRADFVVYDKIILEIKAATNVVEGHVKQTLNYVKAANIQLGIIINFGEDSLKYKRIVLIIHKTNLINQSK